MTTQTEQKPLSVRRRYRYQDVIRLLSAGQAGFSNPVSLALGPEGLLHVANRANPNQPEVMSMANYDAPVHSKK